MDWRKLLEQHVEAATGNPSPEPLTLAEQAAQELRAEATAQSIADMVERSARLTPEQVADLNEIMGGHLFETKH